MVAVDILDIPISPKDNLYLLFVQDYFRKWLEAIPLPTQMATQFTAEVVKLFSTLGLPDVVHADQECNFKTSVYARHLTPLE